MPTPPSIPASERYSVTLISPAVTAVDQLIASSGLSKTDVINRAVQALAFLETERAKGHELLIRTGDGTLERIHII